MSVAALPLFDGAAATEAVAALSTAATASTAVAGRRVCTGGGAGVEVEVEVGAEAEVGKGAWQEAADELWSRGKAAFFFAMWAPCASLVDALASGVAAGSGLELPA